MAYNRIEGYPEGTPVRIDCPGHSLHGKQGEVVEDRPSGNLRVDLKGHPVPILIPDHMIARPRPRRFRH